MLKKLSVLALALFLTVPFVAGFGSAAAKSDDLAVLLPESDGVVVLDVNRLFNEALPQILSANQPLLEKVEREAEKIQARTGLDLRRFDRLAIGVKTRELENGKLKFDPVLLARGRVTSGSLMELAKFASEDEYRTESYAGRTIYVFSAKKIVDKNKPKKNSGSILDSGMEKVLGGLSGELALTDYDSTTVVLGPLDRVKDTIGNAPRIGGDLLALLQRKPGAVGSFAFDVPHGMSTFFELDDDELGQGLDSIRRLQGSMDVIPGEAVVNVAAKTAGDEEAENLEVIIDGFRSVFATILKSQKGDDKKAYGRMLSDLKVSRAGDEVFVDLSVPQQDIDVIVGKK